MFKDNNKDAIAIGNPASFALLQVCNLLKRRDIRFKTCYLNVGDYCWFHRSNGAEVQLPVIVERKRAGLSYLMQNLSGTLCKAKLLYTALIYSFQ